MTFVMMFCVYMKMFVFCWGGSLSMTLLKVLIIVNSNKLRKEMWFGNFFCLFEMWSHLFGWLLFFFVSIIVIQENKCEMIEINKSIMMQMQQVGEVSMMCMTIF
jgi:hypothetical protein